ncbi:MAG: ATP-grasp domain-containing protein [Ignavibacteria bacterium]|nr:ATP-grasp domain-containing protein [Ignavibacteria bacterium]
MQDRKLNISIIFNDPVQYAKGPVFENSDVNIDEIPEAVDMSEYGVLDEVRSVERALEPLEHNTKIIPVALDINKLIDELRENRPDIIFNLCESVDGDPTQEMNIAGLFELMKIPYTGSRAFTLGLALNKPLVKAILNQHGIPTAKHFVVNTSSFELNGYRFPMIVKPSREDASIGIDNESVVRDENALRKRVEYILDEHKQPALVEEYIDGREINVSVVGNEELITFPISEIDFTGLPEEYPRIITYNAKWMYKTVEFTKTKAVCPAENLSETDIKIITDTAKKVYRLLGACDYARVDMRYKDGVPYVLELNPNPDIASDVPEDTGFTRSAKAFGWEYSYLIQQIIKFALKRWGVCY